MLGFTVTTQGAVADIKVEKSSGFQKLDNAAVLCVQGWLFKPAMREGIPVAIYQRARIGWTIPETGTPEPSHPTNIGVVTVPVWAHGGFTCERWHAGSDRPPHAAVLTFFVEPDGSTKDITITQSSGRDDVDKDAVECLGERHYNPATRDGTPIEVHITDWLY